MTGLRSAACVLAVAAAAAISTGCASPGRAQRVDGGFLYSRDRAINDALRTRAVGPLFETQSSSNAHFTAIRPFFSELDDGANERTARYYLWPVASHREFNDESSWRFLLLFGHDFDRNEPGSRYRLFLFPLFFAGRDAQRESYMALFPLGGTIREFLGEDRITFFLFPLYCSTSKNETRSWNVLWPLISRTEGPRVHRWRVFPLYGESELEGKWSKRFVAWPIWTQAEYTYSNANGHAWMVWPLVGRVEMSDQSSWMFLPPFFRWTRTNERSAFYGPWPFFQMSSGDVDKLYIWPLWGSSSGADGSKGFALWPIVTWGSAGRGDSEKRWVTVAPLWQSDSLTPVSTNGVEPGASERNVRLWPLFSYSRQGDASRLRILELWPLPATAGVEQNWAPLWTLYRQIRVGDAEEDEFLWGLYRHSVDGPSSYISLFPVFSRSSGGPGGEHAWSVLCGLAGHRSSDSGSETRLLYLFRIRSENRKETDHQTP